MGSPALLANPVLVSGQLIGHHPAAWNAAFATIQLLLAAGLLWRRTVRAALAGTIVWSLGVWWLGEGLGGIFSGMASPITGAPGAAILYALIAVLVWPAADGPPGSRRPRLAWLAVWGSAAVLLLQAANRAPLGLHDTFAGLAAGEPGWIASIDHFVAAAIGGHGTLVSVLLAVACAAIGTGVLIPRAMRPALAAGILIAVAIWVAGENFGGIFTGRGTDPSTGPLLFMLAVACWPRGTGAEPGRERIVRV